MTTPLQRAMGVLIPNGRWRGRMIVELLTEGEEGVSWIRYAARKHEDPRVRAAAYALEVFLDDPHVGAIIPELVIRVPFESGVRLANIAASEDDIDRLIQWIRRDPGRREIVERAWALQRSGS